MEKVLSFKVESWNGEMKNPRWVKTLAQNAECPQCDDKMIVIMGAKPGQKEHFLYAYCPRCKDYFIGE